MTQQNLARLTEGNVPQGIIKMALPMIMGMLGMVIFNVTDTFFVSMLGADELAALSFTFPVVLVFNSISQGIGLSSSALVSQAIGEQDMPQVRALATHSLALGLVVIIIATGTGLATIRPLFRLLGAEGIILDFIYEYMSVWYLGLMMVVIPMIGNNIIRATGDTKTPGTIMVISATINIILDPLIIFGLGPFPALGVRGAALATVVARSFSAVAVTYVLCFRDKLLTFATPKVKEIWNSWRQLLYIAGPNALIQMALPLSSGIITRILAAFGPSVVAGFGVATKVQMFATVFMGALAAVMGPFTGQNLGARRFDRVTLGRQTAERMCLLIGLGLMAFLALFARPIALIFSRDPAVYNITIIYLRIVPLGYGFYGILRTSATVLNVLKKPFHSSGLIILQTFGLYVPLALYTSRLWGPPGVFVSLVLSYLIAGSLAHLALVKQIAAAEERLLGTSQLAT
ncbi:MAG: MATE family efflux transporter [Limnochordia bacterium]